MSKAKKLLVIMLIVTILMPLFPCKVVWATDNSDDTTDYSDIDYTSPEQQARFQYFYKYVTTYVKLAEEHDYVIYDRLNLVGYHGAYHQNDWPISKIGYNGVKDSGPYSNKIVVVCSVFTASMLHQAWGADIVPPLKEGEKPYYEGNLLADNPFEINDADYSDPRGVGRGIFYQVPDSDPMYPGDVLRMNGHSAIYIGINPETGKHQFAETGGFHAIHIRDIQNSDNLTFITPGQIYGKVSSGECKVYAVHRLLPEKALANWNGVPSEIRIQWPDGSTTSVDPDDLSAVEVSYDESAPLYYTGLANPIGTLGTQNRLKDLIKGIYDAFKNILKFAIGIPALVLRMPFVGFAHLAEVLVGSATQVMSSDSADRDMTLEKIIFNKVPLFDINIFNFDEAGGQQLTDETEGQNVIIALREGIAGWYVAFRNLVIVVLFVILIYLGIRMAITSIAEEKANYKRMLVDWFVSFVIVMFIHYFLIIVLGINDHLVNTLYNAQSMDSLYEEIKYSAYTSIEFTEGWYSTIMFIALVWYMVKYAWKYAKRMLSGYILIMLAPLVAISYAIDKIKDNKAQSLGKWMKEITYTVLIQAAHCLIYVTFVSGIIGNIVGSDDNIFKIVGTTIFLIIAIKFMDTAENIFKNIFGFESSSILKEVLSTSFEMFAKVALARKVLKVYGSIGRAGLKLTGKTIKFAGKGVGLTGRGLTKLSYKVAPTTTANMRDFKNRKMSGLNRVLDGLAGVQVDKTQETMSNVKQLMSAYESRRFNDPYGYSARAKKMYGLEKQAISNLGQGIHFVLDEGTSATSGAVKLLVASMAGAGLARMMQRELRRELRRGEKRQVKGPKIYGKYDSTTGELSKIDKRNYTAPKGMRGRLREYVRYNLGERLLVKYMDLDVALTKSTNQLHIGDALGPRATEAEKMQAEKNAFGFVVEVAKRPSLKDVSDGVAFAKDIELSPGANVTMTTTNDAYEMVEKVLQAQRDSAKGASSVTISAKEVKSFVNRKDLEQKYKDGIEKFVVQRLLTNGVAATIPFNDDLKQKFEQTESEIKQKAELFKYDKAKTEELLQIAFGKDLHKVVTDEKMRKTLLNGLGEDNVRKIITNVDNAVASIHQKTVEEATRKQEPILSKGTFTRRYTTAVEGLVVKNLLEKNSKDKFIFNEEYQKSFSNVEQEAREQAKTNGLNKKKTEEYVQRVLKESVQKIMNDEATQKALLEQIGTERLVTLATNVANDMKTIDGKETVKITKRELLEITKKEGESKSVETFFSNAIDEIERKSGVRIDRDKALENIKTSIDEIYAHKATGEPESIDAVLGKDLGTLAEKGKEIRGKKLTDKRLEELKEKYSLSPEQIENVSDKSKTEDEKYEALVEAITHNDLNDLTSRTSPRTFSKKQTEFVKELSIEDRANLLARGLAKEGSVEIKKHTKEEMLKTIYGNRKEYTKEMNSQVDTLQIVLKNLEATQRAQTETTLRLELPAISDLTKEMRKRIETTE